MISKYGIFSKVVETGSFTKTAKEIGYSQSAVSQTVKNLEKEMGVTLIERKKEGVVLTDDGKRLINAIRSIYIAENSLEEAKRELLGLESGVIKIGTFTSVSRNILPVLMKNFKMKYPGVRFILKQGEYSSIKTWVYDGSVDFGFIIPEVLENEKYKELYTDELYAVLFKEHPLSKHSVVSLKELSSEPFILLDEGEYSLTLDAFSKENLKPNIEYKVTDDYTILSMVRENLGVSAVYENMLRDFETDVAIRRIKECPKRKVVILKNENKTLPLASEKFYKYISNEINGLNFV